MLAPNSYELVVLAHSLNPLTVVSAYMRKSQGRS